MEVEKMNNVMTRESIRNILTYVINAVLILGLPIWLIVFSVFLVSCIISTLGIALVRAGVGESISSKYERHFDWIGIAIGIGLGILFLFIQLEDLTNGWQFQNLPAWFIASSIYMAILLGLGAVVVVILSICIFLGNRFPILQYFFAVFIAIAILASMASHKEEGECEMAWGLTGVSCE